MSKDFIAPIQVVHLFVVDSTFHIENEPSQNMDLKVDVSYQDVHLLRNKAGERADLKLYVCGSLIDRDDAKEKMRADVSVAISVSSKLPFDISDDEARRYLLSNAISMAYGHAKSYLMVVTGLSPMGALTLPAILPSELAADSDASFQSE